MSIVFSTITFFGLIVTAVAAIAWGVGKLRRRTTKAGIVCIAAAVVTVVSFIGFGVTRNPDDFVKEPPPAESVAQDVTPDVTTAPEASAAPSAPEEPPAPPEPTAAPPTSSTQSEPTTTPEPTSPEPIQVNLPLQERPVMNGAGTERIGTWARIITTKEYLATISGRALYDHLEGMAGENYNWVNVTFGDGTGLYCYMDGYLIEYGCVDETEGGAVEPGDGVDIRYFHFDENTETYIEDIAE